MPVLGHFLNFYKPNLEDFLEKFLLKMPILLNILNW
jgi:hypothetical protein